MNTDLIGLAIEEEPEYIDIGLRESQAYQPEMNPTLKKSLSQNALNTIKRRNSTNSLHRTLSQSSCFSTSSSTTAQIRDDSYREFLLFLIGEENAKICWENLPRETKNVFIAKALKKSNYLKSESTLKDPSLSEILKDGRIPTKNSFFYYRNRVTPHIRNSEREHDAIAISKIASGFYNNELSESERQRLKLDAKKEYDKFLIQRRKVAEQFIDTYDKADDCDLVYQQLKEYKSQLPLEESLTKLTEAVERLSSQVSNTPVTPIEKMSTTTVSKPKLTATNKPSNDRNAPIMQSIYGRFIGKFKRKKKPAGSTLIYRKPVEKCA